MRPARAPKSPGRPFSSEQWHVPHLCSPIPNKYSYIRNVRWKPPLSYVKDELGVALFLGSLLLLCNFLLGYFFLSNLFLSNLFLGYLFLGYLLLSNLFLGYLFLGDLLLCSLLLGH